MSSQTNEIHPIRWWVATERGSFLLKTTYNSVNDGGVKYYILEAQEKHFNQQTHNYNLLQKLIVHDADLKKCTFLENGVKGEITLFDKFGRQLYTKITDLKGNSKPVVFNGDILAITKCIRYMQDLSKASSWVEFEQQVQTQTIKTLNETIGKLKKDMTEKAKCFEALTKYNQALQKINQELQEKLARIYESRTDLTKLYPLLFEEEKQQVIIE